MSTLLKVMLASAAGDCNGSQQYLECSCLPRGEDSACRTLNSPVVLNLVLHCANSLYCSMAGSISRLWGVLLLASMLGFEHMIACGLM